MSEVAADGPATSFTVPEHHSGKTFVDTSVLAYLFDDREPAKQRRAEQTLHDSNDLVVSTQVMLELFSVLTRKFEPPLTAGEGKHVLATLRRLEVVSSDADLVMQAAHTADQLQLSIWDAMIVEAACMSGCDRLLTEDLTDGATLRGVRIVNPFATG